MKTRYVLAASLLIGLISSSAWAQDGAMSEQDVLKMDVGVWKAEAKMYAGPGEPEVSEGVERNQMIGDHWVVSSFKGEFAGLDFAGHGTTGYDAKSKKFVTHWIDSMSPFRSTMKGTFDQKTKTMTYEGESYDPGGNPVASKNVTVYKDDGSRVMTMYSQMPGSEEMTKVMEIVYTKQK